MNVLQSKKRGVRYLQFGMFALITALTLFGTVSPAFAAVAGAEDVVKIVDQMADIIGMIFVAGGVLLLFYSVGTLISAFKNDDPDSKFRASTSLVVSIVLIAFPKIVDALDLTSYILGA